MRWEVQAALISACGIVLSAGLSATAVIVTQQFAEGRSERERIRSREAEEARRSDERAQESRRLEATRAEMSEAYQRTLEERWRDERRNAHGRALSALDAVWTPANRFITWQFGIDDDDVPDPPTFPMASEVQLNELSEAQSIVELIGSPAAVEALRQAVSAAEAVTWMAPTGRYQAGSYWTRYEEYERGLNTYRAAARSELGVEGSAPTAPDSHGR